MYSDLEGLCNCNFGASDIWILNGWITAFLPELRTVNPIPVHIQNKPQETLSAEYRIPQATAQHCETMRRCHDASN